MGIVEDNAGKIWFANLYTGVCCWDPSTKMFTHITEADGFCNDTVTCIYNDVKGNIWFGCGSNKYIPDGRLCRYNETEKTFSTFGKMQGDASTDVWSIVEEIDGTMWVETRGGLWKYHSASHRFVDYTYKVNSGN